MSIRVKAPPQPRPPSKLRVQSAKSVKIVSHKQLPQKQETLEKNLHDKERKQQAKKRICDKIEQQMQKKKQMKRRWSQLDFNNDKVTHSEQIQNAISQRQLEQHQLSIRPKELVDGQVCCPKVTQYWKDKQRRLRQEALVTNKAIKRPQSGYQLRNSSSISCLKSQEHSGIPKSENRDFGELKHQVLLSHRGAVQQTQQKREANIKEQRERVYLKACFSQRQLREGFTSYNIINFSPSIPLLPQKKESLGKVFDYQRATAHNFRPAFIEHILGNARAHNKHLGVCAQYCDQGVNHRFIGDHLKRV